VIIFYALDLFHQYTDLEYRVRFQLASRNPL